MKKQKRTFWRFITAIFLSINSLLPFGVPVFSFPTPVAEAAIPRTLGYQGRLKNSSGTAQNGNFSFTFRFYTTSTGGTAVWSETQPSVSVDNSFFAVQLGSVTPFTEAFDFSRPLFLSTEVNGDGEMTPRVAVNSVAYALTAGAVDAFDSAPVSATGGRMYYDTTNGSLNYYDSLSSSWVSLGSSTGTLQTVTNGGNVTTNALQFNGGTSTANFSVTGNLQVTGSSTVGSLNATNATITGLTVTNLTVLGSNPASFTNISWSNATGTNTTSTNFFATNGNLTNGTITNGTISNLSFTNGTSTSWLGFNVASGTTLNANAASIASLTAPVLTSSNATLSGGAINNMPIGAITPSTGVFTNVTSTSATTTNLFATNLQATNATIANLTITGTTPSSFANLIWTNATGTNTTSTNLYVSGTASTTQLFTNTATVGSLNAGSGSFVNVLSTSGTIAGFMFTNATGTNLSVTNGTVASLNSTSGTFQNLVFTNGTSTSWFGFSTASGSSVNALSASFATATVMGQAVCLANGVGCPATAVGSQSLAQVTAVGATTTATLQLFGGFLSSSSTVTSTFTVLGSSSLQGVSFTSATGTSITATNVTSTNLAVSGNVSTNLIPSLDTTLSLGSSALRWNANFGNVTSTSVTSTNFFATNLQATTGTITTLNSTNGTITSLSSTNGAIANLLWTNATGTNTTSTNLFAQNFNALTTTLGNLTVTGTTALQTLTWTNATGTTLALTSLSAASGTVTNLNSTTGTITNLNSAQITAGSVTATTASITSSTIGVINNSTLNGGNATFNAVTSTNLVTTNSTSTNLFATNVTGSVVSSTSLIATSATLTNLSVTNLTLPANSTATFSNLVWTNAIGTNTTSTNLFAVNGVVTNFSGTNGTFTTLTSGSVTATTLGVTSATIATLNNTDLNTTNLITTNGTLTNLTFANGTSTSWLGFATASGTTINALTGTIVSLTSNNLTSSNATISGGSINGTQIGNTNPSTGVFTNVTSTSVTSTNLFASNANISNLTVGSISVTGTAASNFTNLTWTNATGTNTTSTNLFATNFRATSGTVATLNIGLGNIDTLSGNTVTFATGNFTTLLATSGTVAGFAFTNATGTRLVLTDLSLTNGTSTNFNVTNLTGTNGTLQSLSFTGATGTWLNATTVTSSNIYASSIFVNGEAVCLQSGLNCPPSGAAIPSLAQVTDVGATTTAMLQLYGGFLAASSTVTSTFTVGGTTNLQGVSFTSATGNSLTATNVTTTNLAVSGNASTNLIPSLDATLSLGSSALRWNGNFGNVTSTSVTTTNFFATNLQATTGTITTLNSSNGNITTLSSTNGTIANLIWTNATGTNTTSTNLFAQNLSGLNANLGNVTVTGTTAVQALTWTNATGTTLALTSLTATSGTISTLNSTQISSGSVTATTASFSSSSITTLNNSTLNGGNATFTNVTSTNLSATNITGSTVSSTNLIGANATVTSLSVTSLTLPASSTANFANITWINATGTNTTSTNLFATSARFTSVSSTALTVQDAFGLAADFSFASGFGSIWKISSEGLRLQDAAGTEYITFTPGNPWTFGPNIPQVQFANSITPQVGGGASLGSATQSWQDVYASGTFYGVNSVLTNATTTNLFVSGIASTTQLFVSGQAVCLQNGVNCPPSGAAIPSLADVTNVGATSSATLQLYGGFLAASSTVTSTFTVLGNTSLQNVTASNATATNLVTTNSTSTNFFATNVTGSTVSSTNLIATSATLTNLSVTNLTLPVSSTANFSNITWTNATGTNTTTTNLFATSFQATSGTVSTLNSTTFVTTNGTIQNLSFANGTSTSWFGFATASGTTINALTGTIISLTSNNLTSSNAIISGGSINGTQIGNTNPSTGVFTNVTSTSVTSTNLFASSASIMNLSVGSLSVTGTAASNFTNLTWTNATGTNTTSTNLFATSFKATSGTVATLNVETGNIATLAGSSAAFSSGSFTTLLATSGTVAGFAFTSATGTNLTVTNVTSTNLYASGTASSTNLFANTATFATATVMGQAVCLANGVGCPAAQGGSQSLAQVTAIGATTTATLQLYGGFVSASSTVTSTFTVLGNTSLQNVSFVNATATSVTTTNLFAAYTTSTNGFVTTQGRFLGPDGSFSEPTYSFLNDSDTGVLYGGVDQLAFAAGGAIRMRVGGDFVDTTITPGTSANLVLNTGAFLPGSNNTLNIGSSTFSWADIYASGTVRVGTDVLVNGLSVCLSDGTNCPGASSETLASVSARGSFATTTLQLYGGFVGASSTVTSTFTVLGNTSLQGVGFTSATGNSVTATNVTTTNLGVSGNVSTNLTPSLDATLSLGSSALRWNGNFGNVTSTSVTTTNFFATNLQATTGTITTLNSSNGNITTLSSTNGTIANLIWTNATGTNTTSTNLFANNASFLNLTVGSISVTGTAPSSYASLTWTNATGTNTTSTSLFATSFRATSGTIETGAITNFFFTGATGTWLNASTVTSTSLFTNAATIAQLGTSNLTWVNATGTNTTSTNFFTTNFQATSGTATTWNVGTFNVSGLSSLQALTFTNGTATNVTTTNLFVSGIASTTQLFVNGQNVCLQNGTNCPPGGGATPSLAQITAVGATTTQTLQLYGGFVGASSTVTSTFTVLGGTTLANATATNVTTTNLAVSGNISTNLLPSLDSALSLGSPALRWNGNFGSVTATAVTATNIFATLASTTNLFVTNGTATRLTLTGDVKVSTPGYTADLGINAFPNRAASTDPIGLTLNTSSTLKSGFVTEVQGSLLSFAINASQLGDRVTSTIGAIFRMDTRANSPYWSLKRQPAGNVQTEISDFQITTDGFFGFGAGHASDLNTMSGLMHLFNASSSKNVLVVQGAQNQAGYLTQWSNNAGTAMLGVTATGSLSFLTATGSIIIPSSGTLNIFRGSEEGSNLVQIRDVNTAFGAALDAGAFMDRNSAVLEDFNKQRTTISADTSGANGAGMGDGGGWGAYENGTCVISSLADTANGVMRLAKSTGGADSCLVTMDEGLHNPRSILVAGNLPIMMMKIRPSATGASNNVYVGMGDSTDGLLLTAPTNFVGFTNQGGATWTGVARSTALESTVTCTGQTISTTQFALLMVQFRTATDVRFFVDSDVSDGISFSECGSGIQTNIPSGALAPQIHWADLAGDADTNLDIDFYRAWQDDGPGGEGGSSSGTPDFTTMSTIAQYYPADDLDMPVGTVVALESSTSTAKVAPVTQPYDPNFLGVVVVDPGVILSNGSFDGVRVATQGRVEALASIENGAISKGDVLTTGSATGTVMKATGPGPSLGRALEDFDGATTDTTVLILIQPGYYIPSDDGVYQTLSAKGYLSVGDSSVPQIGPSAIAQFAGTTNTYLQVNLQNTSNGENASGDFVITNDIGTDSSYYVDMGINSSGYNNPDFSITGPNDAYFYAHGNNLTVGTASSSGDLIFHTGGTLLENERMRITADGLVGIGTSNPTEALTVVGSIGADGLTVTYATATTLTVNGTATFNTVTTSELYVNGKKVCLEDGTNCSLGQTLSASSSASVNLSGSETELLAVTTTVPFVSNTVWVTANLRAVNSNALAGSEVTARIRRGSCTTGVQVGVDRGVDLKTVDSDDLSLSFVDAPATNTTVTYRLCAIGSGGTPSASDRSMSIEIVKQGADLAEVYYSTDETLAPGEVIAIAGTSEASVERTTKAYDARAFGVVSTRPGSLLVDSAHTVGVPVLIALAGRVPVKVSLENGPIYAGDTLTAASMPGYAMKATEAGVMIGRALSDFDGATTTDSGATTTGYVMMFVQNGYSLPSIAGSELAQLDQSSTSDTAAALQPSASTPESQLPAGSEILTGAKIDVLIVEQANFTKSVTVSGGLTLQGPVVFGKKNSGRIQIQPGQSTVSVVFTSSTGFVPHIFLSPELIDRSNGLGFDHSIWNGAYYLANVTSTGFEIRLPQGGICATQSPCPVELWFNWFVTGFEGEQPVDPIPTPAQAPAENTVIQVNSEPAQNQSSEPASAPSVATSTPEAAPVTQEQASTSSSEPEPSAPAQDSSEPEPVPESTPEPQDSEASEPNEADSSPIPEPASDPAPVQ